MQAVQTDADPREFLGKVDLPLSSFRIRVTGTDMNGYPYQRVANPLFHAATVALSLVAGPEHITPGRTTVFTYRVLNLGDAATFQVVAASGRSFGTVVEPVEVALATGETAKLRVSVTVPHGTPPFTGSDLTVTVRSRTDPAISNGTSQHLSVSPEPP